MPISDKSHLIRRDNNGSIGSKWRANNIENNLKSTFNKLIGRYKVQCKGSLFFFSIKDIEA